MSNQENPQPEKKKYLSREFVCGAAIGGMIGILISLATNQAFPDAIGTTISIAALVGGTAVVVGIINQANLF